MKNKKTRVVSIATIAILMLTLTTACISAEMHILGHDAIAKIGESVTLRAKLEQKILGYISPDLSDKKISFVIDDQVIGEGTTNSDGIAEISHTVSHTTMHKVSYIVAGKQVKQRKGRIFMISQTRPAIVVDIDGTISNYSDWKVPLWGDKAPAFPYAAEMLGKLAKDYDIIYLTARDDALDKVTLAFLNKHQFPAGPILYNSWGFSTKEKREQLFSKNHGDFKYRTIKKLLDKGVQLVAGIGNAPTDADAYLKAGLDAYILKSSKEIDANAIVFDDYQKLEEIWQEKDEQYRKKTGS